MTDPNALNIYTDGSSKGTPRSGGVGVRLVFPDSYTAGDTIQDLVLPGYSQGSIGAMELQACVEALKAVLKIDSIHPAGRIVIYSDSQYVVDGYQNALYTWPNNGWCKKNGSPVLNAPQWKELCSLAQKVCKKHRVGFEIKKVQGHSTSDHNRAADHLAKASATVPHRKATNVNVRRKIGTGRTEVGSIKAEGQVLRLCIIGGEYLSTQKLFKYRCEVISKQSPYYGKIDFICSPTALFREGYCYRVQLTKDSKSPHIIKRVIGEVTRPR